MLIEQLKKGMDTCIIVFDRDNPNYITPQLITSIDQVLRENFGDYLHTIFVPNEASLFLLPKDLDVEFIRHGDLKELQDNFDHLGGTYPIGVYNGKTYEQKNILVVIGHNGTVILGVYGWSFC